MIQSQFERWIERQAGCYDDFCPGQGCDESYVAGVCSECGYGEPDPDAARDWAKDDEYEWVD